MPIWQGGRGHAPNYGEGSKVMNRVKGRVMPKFRRSGSMVTWELCVLYILVPINTGEDLLFLQGGASIVEGEAPVPQSTRMIFFFHREMPSLFLPSPSLPLSLSLSLLWPPLSFSLSPLDYHIL